MDNLGTSKNTVDIDKVVDNLGIGINIANADKRANPSISTNIADKNRRIVNLSISIDTVEKKQISGSRCRHRQNKSR